MRRFRLCEHKRVTVDGEVHVHARLRARRGDDWAIVGVFQLREDEWQLLTEVCEFNGITVMLDVEEPSLLS